MLQTIYPQLKTRIRKTVVRFLPDAVKRQIKASTFFRRWRFLKKTWTVSAEQGISRLPELYRDIAIFPELGKDEQEITSTFSRQTQGKLDVIAFSIVDWETRYQRPQQMMAQFAAQGHRVFYLSTSKFLPATATSLIAVREIQSNLFEVSLASQCDPNIYGAIDGENRKVLLAALEELRQTYQIDEALSYVMIASWGAIALSAKQQWGWQVLYDCMDEWATFPGISQTLLEMELRLVEKADLIVVTAQRLYDKWKPYNRPMTLVRNATDYKFYQEHCQPNQILPELGHPVIGYYGAIAEWFDLDLMEYVAMSRPNYIFVLLGGIFDVDVSRLKNLPNVRLLGQQLYETMPQYLYQFDACLIPFKINAVTDATDPVKFYEYISGGKPVISVAMPELEAYRKYVYIAENKEEFVAQIDRALLEDSAELAAQRRSLASEHTWEHRQNLISTSLRDVTPRASIIIVTWNNLAMTTLCIESLLLNTNYQNYEIIIVDNNSSTDMQEYLQALVQQHHQLKIILNTTNNGFAKANNQGIDISSGDYIVLLNNDTIVPTGWLSRLLRHLQDPTIGIVGPMTNSIGNEAKIPVSYQTWEEMEIFAASHVKQHHLQIADIHMLAMYCVAFRRETYEKIGPLDEQYGIGMFEDDDYSERMKAIGLRVVCAADVFVHHFGQASFKKLITSGEYNPLFEENRRRFELKWQRKWIAHKHATLSYTPHQVP